MNLHFFEDAEAEFSKAAFYYEDQQPGLGKRYRDEIVNVLSRIIQALFYGENPFARFKQLTKIFSRDLFHAASSRIRPVL